ncbi:MAG: DNA polymerase III subunit epsilon [Treponema sp.]|nr:MAG: DNA polymerase III subunit epsilon [Treponema sp.]
MSSFDWISAVHDKAVFVAFDTETTGVDAKKDRVVEIGAIKFDKLGIISRYNVLINPEMPMPPGATAVNNITDDMLKDKPVIKDVIHQFLMFIQNTVLVAHNAPFDLNMLNSELKRLGGTELTNKVFDTLVFAREVLPGLRSYALQKLAEQFGINAIDAHRAEDDARVCMEFFNVALKHFFETHSDMLEHYKQNTNINDYLKTKAPTFNIISNEKELF